MKKTIKHNISYRWVPYILILLFTIITLSISFWGPLEYYNYKRILVFTYVVCFLLITWMGTYIGLKSKTKINTEFIDKRREKFRKNIAIITFVVFFIKSALLVSSIKIYGIPDASGFLNLMAQTYTQKSLGDFADTNIFRQIDTFTTFLYIISVCGILYDWKKVKKKVKVVMLINVILTLIYTLLFLGDQKPFMDVVIYILSAILVFKIRKGERIFSFKNTIKVIVLLLIVVLFFSSIIMNRRTLWGSQSMSFGEGLISLNLDHPSLALIPASMKYQVGSFLLYPTMGWYGLSLTLQMPFQWTYFLGGARGINNIVSQFIPNIPYMYDKTYLGRMESQFGYDGLSNWNTIFPWLASDFTFIGALIFMGFIAYIYSKSWKQAVEHDNPISFTMFATLNIMYIYIVANNQLFIQRGSTIATLIIFTMWFIKSKYYNTYSTK